MALTQSQTETILELYELYGTDRSLDAHEAYPARDNQDGARRRVVERLERDGWLKRVAVHPNDPRLHRVEGHEHYRLRLTRFAVDAAKLREEALQ